MQIRSQVQLQAKASTHTHTHAYTHTQPRTQTTAHTNNRTHTHTHVLWNTSFVSTHTRAEFYTCALHLTYVLSHVLLDASCTVQKVYVEWRGRMVARTSTWS